jgi:hypothetical protein
MIPADHITFNDDGTAWLVVTPPVSAAIQHFDRPCDNPDCPHVCEPLPVVTLHYPCAVNTAGHEIEGGYRRLGDGRLAHRMVWESQHGPIPEGMVVMHLCDNPPCCEPTHLKLGTRAENNADRDRKGRNRRPNQRGEAHSNAKLTDADVDAILASDEPATVLGPRYGVNPDHIRRIRRGDRRTKKATCPDCDGTGRHTFTVEVEASAADQAAGLATVDVFRVSVVPGMVLPIYGEDEPDENIADGQNFVIYNYGVGDFDLFMWSPSIHFWICEQSITLPSAAAPGMWAVKLVVRQ